MEKGLYIVVDLNVYEMTGFVDEHPGGSKILKRVGGKDASKQFWKVSLGALLCKHVGELIDNSIITNLSWRNTKVSRDVLRVAPHV